MRATARCAVLAVVVVPVWVGAAGRKPTRDVGTPRQRMERRELGREIASLQLVALLKLTPSQRQSLAPLVARAASIQADYDQKLARLIPRMLETYSAFKAEDEKDQGFSKETERRTARLHHEEMSARAAYMDRLQPLDDQVRRLLTREQLALAEGYNPRAEMRGRGPHSRRMHDLAERLRRMSDDEFQRQLPRLAGEHLGQLERRLGRRLPRRQRTARVNEISAMLRRVREQGTKAPKRRSPGRHGPVVRGNDAQTVGLLDQLQQRARGTPFARLSRAGELLLHPGVQAMLDPASRTRPTGTQSVQVALADSVEKLRRLRGDINLLNLINGLNLTSKQISGIVSVVERSQQSQHERRPLEVRSARQLSDQIRGLRMARADLLARGKISDSTRQVLRRASGGHARRRGRDTHRRRSSGSGNGEADTVHGLLTAAQQQVLADYKPCLIPPKNLKNPVRAGQAKDGSRMEGMLTRLRDVPPEMVPFAVDRVLEGEQRHLGKLTGDERLRRKAQLLEVIDAAQQMSDADFELEKDVLASQVEPIEVRAEIMAQLTALGGKDPAKRKVEQFLLDADIVPILRQRQRLLASRKSS